MATTHRVRLFKDGNNQALHIPKDFELPGDEAIILKQGKQLIVKPFRKPSLLAILSTLEILDEDFPNIDTGLLPLDDITI